MELDRRFTGVVLRAFETGLVPAYRDAEVVPPAGCDGHLGEALGWVVCEGDEPDEIASGGSV
jgi:hypothetical protein